MSFLNTSLVPALQLIVFTLFNGTSIVAVAFDRSETIHQLGKYRTECITGAAREGQETGIIQVML